MEIKGMIQSYDINKPSGFHDKGNYVEYVCECGKKLVFIMGDDNEKADDHITFMHDSISGNVCNR